MPPSLCNGCPAVLLSSAARIRQVATGDPSAAFMLKVHQSNRLEALVPALAEACAQPLAHPFAPERIVVPNQGMARWLSLALADQQSICLNVDFALPAQLAWDLWLSTLPDVPRESKFSAAGMRWGLMELLASLPPDAAAPLQTYLADGDDRQRHELATVIAQAFDQYLVYRPEMLLGWEEGNHATTHADEVWQAALWQDLVARSGGRHRARLLAEFRARAATASDLPQRISIFGLPALPPAFFEVLRLAAVHADIHLFVVNPSRAYWTETLSPRAIARKAGDRDPDELYLDVGHPLLASMGAQGREFAAMLLEDDPPTADLFDDPVGDTVLMHLQRDILDLQRPGHGGTPPHEVPTGDDSVLVRGSYSPMREVEALQDWLLHLFDRFPDLDPGDVRVMAPKIEEYAPLIEAVFGAAPEERRVPFAIADLRARAESAVVDAFLGLLELPSRRFEAPLVLGLLEHEAVRARFGIAADDVPRLVEWVREAGIRWGVDAEAREALGLPGHHENSWRFGLDRMMFGFAMEGEGHELCEGVLPLDGVEGSAAELMGALQHFVDRMIGWEAEMRAARAPAAWQEFLAQVVEGFLDPAVARDEIEAIYTALSRVRTQAEQAGFEGEISLDVFRAELEEQLAAPGASWSFQSGGITFCDLVPMRSVPARVVCLLGLDAEKFPRMDRPPSFDLMADEFRPGDRARRDDDRYLFLEALLSAREFFYLSHVSRLPRDGSTVPPSVLVGEFEDAVREGFRIAGTDEPPAIRLEHRLQAFSPSYFGEDEGYFTYREELARALNARERGAEPRSFLGNALPEPDPEWRIIALPRLLSFFRAPAKFFVRERLGLRLEEAEPGVDDTEPFSLEQLERWSVRNDLLAAGRHGEALDEAHAWLRAAGRLPHGASGEILVHEYIDEIDALLARHAAECPDEPAESVRVDLRLGEYRILGEIEAVHADTRIVLSLGTGSGSNRRVDEREIAVRWVEHLILGVLGREVTTRIFAPGKEAVLAVETEPEARLIDLLAIYWQGLRRPSRFLPRVAERFFAKGLRTNTPFGAARGRFVQHGSYGGGGDWDRSPELKLLWPDPEAAFDAQFESESVAVWEPLEARLSKPKKPGKKKAAK